MKGFLDKRILPLVKGLDLESFAPDPLSRTPVHELVAKMQSAKVGTDTMQAILDIVESNNEKALKVLSLLNSETEQKGKDFYDGLEQKQKDSIDELVSTYRLYQFQAIQSEHLNGRKILIPDDWMKKGQPPAEFINKLPDIDWEALKEKLINLSPEQIEKLSPEAIKRRYRQS